LTLQKPRQRPLAMQGQQGFRQPAQQVPLGQEQQELQLLESVPLGRQALGSVPLAFRPLALPF
jgi:hypothetical protein